MDTDWPEMVRGWELARHGHIENYRKRLANNVTITAIWKNEPGTGTISARVEPLGSNRTLTHSRQPFRDKEALWTAAQCVLEMAANLPSLGMGSGQSPADSALVGCVAGTVEAEPGTNGVPEAELTFTLTDGRTVDLILDDEQALELCNSIFRLDKYVWSEQREDDEEDEDAADLEDVEPVEPPDVAEVRPGPHTAHDVITLLEEQFGVTQDYLMAHIDFSAMAVMGEPAIGMLLSRAVELQAALAPRWYFGVSDRPGGEQWVVLLRDDTAH